MFDEIEFVREFFETLTAIDAAILVRAAKETCRFCGGPLHRGDYARKPRGGLLAVAAETFARRFSLCCGREGCRCRATPPSVRFLGRRVYVGAIVIVASVVALRCRRRKLVRAATHATGVPAADEERPLAAVVARPSPSTLTSGDPTEADHARSIRCGACLAMTAVSLIGRPVQPCEVQQRRRGHAGERLTPTRPRASLPPPMKLAALSLASRRTGHQHVFRGWHIGKSSRLDPTKTPSVPVQG